MNQKIMYRLAFAAVAATVLTAGAPLYASETDDKIESAFKKSYVYKVYLKDDSISADSEDGVVTLKGTVAEESRKALAAETAASLPGVIRVDNQLETAAEVEGENADTWIGRKVKLALLFHRNVSGSKTEVDVKDGVVTLKGEAASAAQKELTAQYAADIDGVKSVDNQMTVSEKPVMEEQTMGDKIDDASVTAQVKTALFTHRSTSAIKTQVETKEGVVTLKGVAKNAAEKALVTKLASDIQGALVVKNEMTIEPIKTK